MAWPIAALLVVRMLRAPRRERAALPTLAAIVILVTMAVTALSPVFEPVAALWFIAFPLLLATFPDGRFVPRWLVWPVIGYAVLTLLEILSGGWLSEQPWWSWAIAVPQLGLVAAQVFRYRRRSSVAEREAVRWALLGTLLTIAAFGIVAAVDEQIGARRSGGGGTGDAGDRAASARDRDRPVATRLWDVDAAFRLVVAGLIAAPLSGLPVRPRCWSVGRWIPSPAQSPGGPPAWWRSRPIRSSVCLCRSGLGLSIAERADPASAVARLGQRLHSESEAAGVAGAVVRTVVEVAYLDESADGGRGGSRADVRLRGGCGRPDDPRSFPIVYDGEPIATLVVPPRRGGLGLPVAIMR